MAICKQKFQKYRNHCIRWIRLNHWPQYGAATIMTLQYVLNCDIQSKPIYQFTKIKRIVNPYKMSLQLQNFSIGISSSVGVCALNLESHFGNSNWHNSHDCGVISINQNDDVKMTPNDTKNMRNDAE